MSPGFLYDGSLCFGGGAGAGCAPCDVGTMRDRITGVLQKGILTPLSDAILLLGKHSSVLDLMV